MATFCSGKAFELNAMEGDEFLVRGDDALAGFKRAAHPGACGIEPACELDDDVGFRREDSGGIIAPDDAGWNPINAFAGDAAVEYMAEFETLGLRLHENARD